MVRKVLICLLLLFCFNSTVFAAGNWDLSDYKFVYKAIALANDGTYTDYPLNEESIDSLFVYLSNALNNSSYIQDDYKNARVFYSTHPLNSSINYINFWFVNDTSTDPLSKTFPAGTLNISFRYSNGKFSYLLIKETTDVTTLGSSYYYGNKFPSLWNLTNNDLYYVAPTNQTQFYAYKGAVIGINGIDRFEDLYIDLNNNFVVNRDMIIGNSFNLNLWDFYYIESGEEISIKDLISYEVLDSWFGDIYFFHIEKENIKKLPNNTEFYVKLNTTAKNNYNTEFNFVKKAFKTTSVLPSGDPGGDTPGSSGDSGNVDLSRIESGISDINNNLNNVNNNLNDIENKIPTSSEISDIISSETSKITETITTVPDLSGETITSGEIQGALNLDFIADPYSNFWYELTTGFSHALTDNVRSYEIPWLNGYKYTFNLDTWGFKLPSALQSILISASTISLLWVIVKYWKIIVDKISSGSIDEVLAMNEEEGIIDLF